MPEPRAVSSAPNAHCDASQHGERSQAQHCVIVGTAKAGTTALHAWLARHPAVSASDPKELHYFDCVEHPSPEEYRRLFQPHAGTELLVDATPAYLRLPYITGKIAATIPNAKLVAVLREPVARAHSAWWMNVSGGDESRTFAQVVVDELASRQVEQLGDDEAWMRHAWLAHRASVGSGHLARPTMFLWEGLYARHLGRYRSQFPASQLLVLFYEELIADPDAAAVQLGEFLDLDPTPLSGGLPSENRAVGPRTAAIQRVRARPIGKVARVVLPPSLRRAVKGAVARGDSKPPIASETTDLLAEYYREPNAALAELLGRELPW